MPIASHVFSTGHEWLYVRMALLTMLLEKEPAAGSAWW